MGQNDGSRHRAVKPPAPMTAAEFAAATGITRQRLERLIIYAELLAKWQRRINLVGRRGMADMWRRHFLDSAQLLPHLPGRPGTLLDFGSGAGFPGLVLAVIGDWDVHLVESDSRKCAFLNEVNRVTEAGAAIHNGRIENLEPFAADVVTARACASLARLLAYAEQFVAGRGKALCFFYKGRKAEEELTDTQKKWHMKVSKIESRSDPSGVILKVEGMARRHG